LKSFDNFGEMSLCERAGVDFTNNLCAAFSCKDFFSKKRH
jgi:hypothetical protein